MDVIRFRGGLGNQMFQFAFHQALKYRGRDVRASLGFYRNHPEKMQFCLTEVFPAIILQQISDEEFGLIDIEWRKIRSDKERLSKFLIDYENRFFWVEENMDYHPHVFDTKSCTYVGYWHSEKYFNDIRSNLLKDFTFAYGEHKLEDLRKKILNEGQYVSVHIRRGDYLNEINIRGNLGRSRYYQNAIEYIKNKCPESRLIFFSDDMNWVKENYKYEDAIYIEGDMFESYASWYDMCLMSCCSHNIIANSSFSWWGAWLNQNKSKIVIAPETWVFDGSSQKDVYPTEWIKLEI